MANDIDWRSSGVSEGDITVEMLSPTNLTDSYGVLDGVILSGSKLSASYYGETRTSGTLKYEGNGWRRGSFLRVIYNSKTDSRLKRVLGTYVATSDPAVRDHGSWVTTLSLQSAGLYTLSKDPHAEPWVLNSGAYVRDAMHSILKSVNRPYTDDAHSNKYVSSAVVLERDKTTLSWLNSLASMSGLRLECNQNGSTAIKDYIQPSQKPANMTLDLSDPRGVVVNTNIKRTTDYLSIPGQTAVVFRYTTNEKTSDNKTEAVEHYITATATATGNAAPSVRGYNVVNYYNLSNLDPQTQWHAQELADQYLREQTHETVEWTIKTTYLPLWEGDVINLVVPDGVNGYSGTRKCLVKSVDIDLDTMALSLSLKETNDYTDLTD